MNDLDDRPLVRTPQDENLSAVRSRPSHGGTMIAIAALGLLLGGLGAWWWARDRVAPSTKPVASSGTDGVVPSAPDASRSLPPLTQMDTFLRALLGPLSSSPELVRWLATDDLIRQMAHGIDRVSRGMSPAADLAVLRPKGAFSTVGSRAPWTIDRASYRRYDGVATLVASLDALAVADAYRTIQPRLDEAYRGLGRAEGSVDDAVSVALQVPIDTPIVSEPVRIVHGKGATWAYADPRLEALQPAQKQLLRMGSDNMARVQERLREIKEAIDR